MTQVSALAISTPSAKPAPTQSAQANKAQTTEELVCKEPTSEAKPENNGDYYLRMANYGVGASGSVAGIVAIPNEVIKAAPAIVKYSQIIGIRAGLASVTHSGATAKAAGVIARGSITMAQHTESIAHIARAVTLTPVLGKLFQPNVASTMTQKVIPTINAVGASLSIADNGLRFYRAKQANNQMGQIVAGAQIGLNAIGAVTGFMKGKGALLSMGAGLAGLGLEVAHQVGGLGK